MKIRSITVFADVDLDAPAIPLESLGAFAQSACQAYEGAGYAVQTIRLATSGLAEASRRGGLVERIARFEAACLEAGFGYVSLGPADTAALHMVPEILRGTRACFLSAHMLDPTTGRIDGETVWAAARTIREAAHVDEGFGNLRFAALANVAPGTPFFPAAYADGRGSAFALATEAADLAVDACVAARDAADAHERLTLAIDSHAERLASVARGLDEVVPGRDRPRFLGLDFCLAPYPDPAISIGAALEMLSGQPLGSAGTLAAAGVLADAIDRAEFPPGCPRTGFCGLMLPVLEDPVLAGRSAEGRLRLGELLQWSAVCGTGLDTVPLPGDVSEESLARVLFDVAVLSARLHKPLTARLMPLPGKRAGDPVHFDFPYFADGGVLPLEEGREGGLLRSAAGLGVGARRA